MPESAAGLGHGAGFLAATVLLHALGIGLGVLLGRAGERQAPLLVRSAGALATVAGIAILMGLL